MTSAYVPDDDGPAHSGTPRERLVRIVVVAVIAVVGTVLLLW